LVKHVDAAIFFIFLVFTVKMKECSGLLLQRGKPDIGYFCAISQKVFTVWCICYIPTLQSVLLYHFRISVWTVHL